MNLDALLCPPTGELLTELEAINELDWRLAHSIKQCAVCREPISALSASRRNHRAVTCSKRECGKEHQRRLNRLTAQRQRDRAKLPARDPAGVTRPRIH